MGTPTQLSRGTWSKAARERRGGIMVSALVIIMVVGGLVTGLLQIGVRFNREADQRLEEERCLQLSEAGLTEAVVAMRTGSSGAIADDVTPARLGHGVLWATSQQIGNDVRRIVSSAMVGRARTSVEVLVFHYSDNYFDVALFAGESLVLSSNTVIDSYDPAGGAYSAQLLAAGSGFVGDAAVLQSNGDVQLEAAVEVYGDVHPGHDGSLTSASNATVSGVNLAMPEDRVLDPVTTPALPIVGPLTVAGTTVLPAGDYGFTALTVGTGGDLTIEGPARVVMEDWTLASNSAVTLDASAGPIELYVSMDMTMASNSTITTPSPSAAGVQLNLTGDDTQVAQLRSNGEFHGTIYAPQAQVEVFSNFELFGAIAARAVVLHSNVKLHYDEALHGDDPANETYLVGGWSPVNFPRAQWMKQRRDPFALLGVDPDDLPKPSEAHQP